MISDNSYELAKQRARARKAAQIKAAQRDVCAFIEYVMRDENPATYGAPIVLKPFHREWQEHMEAHDFAMIEAPIGHGKTTNIVGRILFRMGKFPERRVAVCGAVADKVLKAVRQTIERSTRLREVFPNLVPSDDPADPWTDQQITIKRPHVSRDPSLQVCSELGNIVGSRVDDLYLDDILNHENTNTDYSRKKIISWVDSTCQTRITPKIGRVVMIGTPWHKEDALAVFALREGVHAYRCSAVKNPDDTPDRWQPIWPEVWPISELLARRGKMAETEFQRTILCRVRLDATSRFKESWLLYCAQLGRGHPTMLVAPKTGSGRELPCFCGVDLGAGKKEQNARTAIFVAALLDNGRIRPLEADSGIWTGPETVDRLVHVYQRYGARIKVESNAMQIFLVQFAQLAGVNVSAFYTGQNKWDPRFGVESMAVEMRQGMWELPCRDDGDFSKLEGVRWASPGIAALVNQALYFDPSQHTGDMLMAAWLCREAVREYAPDRTVHVDLLSR